MFLYLLLLILLLCSDLLLLLLLLPLLFFFSSLSSCSDSLMNVSLVLLLFLPLRLLLLSTKGISRKNIKGRIWPKMVGNLVPKNRQFGTPHVGQDSPS